MKKISKLAAMAVAILVLAWPAAMAQQATPPAQQQNAKAFTDNEVKQFADANTRLMAIQQETEQQMMGILAEEKLSVDKFNEMAQAHQQQKLAEVQATPEEMAAFNKAAQRIMEMQPALQQRAEAAIQKDGMTLDKYEQLMAAYQQDPALQEKVDQLMAKE